MMLWRLSLELLMASLAKMRSPRSGDFGAVILSGGRSSRMGQDKALLRTPSGKMMIEIVSQAASLVASYVVEVGGNYSGHDYVADRSIHEGPLAASVAGLRAITSKRLFDGIFVLACDLASIDSDALKSLVVLSGGCTVVPVVSGRAQYSCSFISASGVNRVLGKKEFRSSKWSELYEATDDVVYLDVDLEPNLVPDAFLDVDTPSEYTSLFHT